MGVWASVITAAIGTGVKLLGSSQGPDFPSAPTIAKLPVQKAKKHMQQYEAQRMQASIDAWKARFPLLYQGGKYEIDDIGRNQQGYLSDTVKQSLSKAGLDTPVEGDQYKQSVDLGLSPVTLAQRTSQAVTRQIALNPEWTNKISGGTLATMIANNYSNQQAFSQFLGAQNTAKYVAGQQQSMYNTAALTSGLLGTAALGTQAYINAQNPLNRPLDPTAYSDVSSPGYYAPSQPSAYQPAYQPYQPPPATTENNYGNSMWNSPPPEPYGATWDNPYNNYQPFGFGG